MFVICRYEIDMTSMGVTIAQRLAWNHVRQKYLSVLSFDHSVAFLYALFVYALFQSVNARHAVWIFSAVLLCLLGMA